MDYKKAIEALKTAQTIYQKLSNIPGYVLNQEDLADLVDLKRVYETGLIDDPILLQAAKVNIEELAIIVGNMLQLGLIAPVIYPYHKNKGE